jgi:hypothetical protein
MSIIDNGHLVVSNGGEEGSEAAVLVGWREAADLHAGACAGRFGSSGGPALCD